MKRWNPELGLLDHVLATLACLLAMYSIGMSLSNMPMAFVLTGGTLVSAISGYALASIVRKTKLVNYDSYFWAILGILAVGMVNVLNDLLPGNGFPFELIAAGALCWILLIGNLFAWRDQTLLFLSLPCIAIFGLVGTFDTFAPATIMFFLFMITIAVLYARIHHRAMIERAMRAGVDEPGLLRRGPWKWMAGPEWALASALTIILFSFMGAPVLRFSLSNVAGRVQVSLPQPPDRNTNNQQREEQSDVRVGTGPTFVSEQQVFKIKIDQPRYLRLNAFSTYTGSGWRASSVTLPANSRLLDRRSPELESMVGPHGGVALWSREIPPPFEPIERGDIVPFTLTEPGNLFRSVVSPGPVAEIEADPGDFTVEAQGWVRLDNALRSGESLTAYALVPTRSPETRRAELPEAMRPIQDLFLSKTKVPARVRDLAYRATIGKRTDYEKAVALKEAIERRVVYNTRANRTPREEDPVEHFLFESREGYCDLFASSMALLARSAGLPSRYVIGYIVNNPERDADGYYTVRGKDYHAWCEIYFEGVGWVPFDPTEGAPSVDEEGQDGAGNWYQSTWFKGAVGGIVLLALLAPVVVMLRQRTTPGAGKQVRTATDVAKLQNAFFRAIEKFVNSPKRFSQTAREFVGAHAERLGPTQPLATALVGDFEHAMFSERLPSSEKLGEIAQRLAEFRTSLGRLKKQAP